MLVTIKKGKHLSNQLPWLDLGLFNNGQIVAEVMFHSTCRYILKEGEQEDWNKLNGRSWGIWPLIKSYMMHWNSDRWAWRYNPKTDKIELSPYFYIEGVRFYAESLGIEPGILNLNQKYRIIIKPFYKSVLYIIEQMDGKVLWRYEAKHKAGSKIGFLAPGYFGGTETADHDIDYIYKRL